MSAPGSRHEILISTDGHCGADLRDYRPYLESAYHDRFDAWAAGYHDAWAEIDVDRDPNHRSGVASASASVNWDAGLRLQHLDGQGIAAEVLFPNTTPPFYPSGAVTAPGPRSQQEYELRWAGVKAHNRWLADFVSEAPERWAGFAQLFLDDVDAAVAEVRWAAEHGFRGVLLPNDHVQHMAGLYYPEYDPLWAACAELGLPVHRHTNFPTEPAADAGGASVLVGMFEMQFYIARTITHMILAGVFERHPDLNLVVTEITSAAEVLEQLARLDGLVRMGDMEKPPFHEHIGPALAELSRLPSEYFATNCYIAGPTHDLRQAHDLGVPNLMWGADFPHSEGTSPYTSEFLRLTLGDLPADDLDELLWRRAADVYHFDVSTLQDVADRVGPTLDQIATPLTVDELPSFPDETRCTVFMSRRSLLQEAPAG
jgi:predicted TIM-barrel fold metal-dependent hydrolase